MDENRFSYKQHYNAPLMIGEAFDGNKKLTVQEMVDLLNELAEENEQLKQEVFVYKKAFQQQVQRCTL